ncbi:hypothetical protein PENTCL1PPCAC_21613, partial [Pristionchus entomophagus]
GTSAKMTRLLLFFSILQLAYSSCPDGFELVRDGECRGKYTSMLVRDDEDPTATAVAKCAEINGKPVIIHDDEHQRYWGDQAHETQNNGNFVLLALECNTTSKKWVWADGSPVDYLPPVYYDPALLFACKPTCTWVLFWGDTWGYGCSDMEFTYDVFCTVQLDQPAPSGDVCESFEDDSDDGVCYQISLTSENWQEAQKVCRSFGADLASIHSSQENSFVRRLAVSRGAVNGVYLGATAGDSGNTFAWTDGSAWDYDNFQPGYPNTGLGDCVAINTQNSAGEWTNVNCTVKQAVACERKQHYTPPACSSGPWNEGDIIYSPGFPFNASTPCDFTLTVEKGKKVEVEILLLEANSCCDHLVISENDVEIANLTGEVNDKKFTTSSTNSVRVSWQPKGGENVRGMMMTFRGV